MPQLVTYLQAFAELFYPRICLVCNEKLIATEKHLCLTCLLHLPRTNYHKQAENKLEELFYGRVQIHRASAYFEFKKGSSYQKVLHHLKYRGQKELGEFMGNRFAEEIKQADWIRKADLLCPVPLHPKKERKRGYNQSFHIAKGMAQSLQIPISRQDLIRKKFSSTQTRKARYERWENVSEIFELKTPAAFEGKHVILIDDVVTTGSTLEACAQTILNKCQCQISVLTLAIA